MMRTPARRLRFSLRAPLSLLMLGLLACSNHAPPAGANATTSATAATNTTTATTAAASTTNDPAAVATQAASRVAAAEPAPTRCGALSCWRLDRPETGFAMLLARNPRVLAIGEAHAQRGTEAIRSSTERFRTQLLPLAKGRASDIVLELLNADGSCKQVQQKVAKVQKPVVQKQAAGNQNQFLQLGHAAKDLGIRPHVLWPSCDDYRAVVAAGPDGIPQMLTMIATLSDAKMRKLMLGYEEKKSERVLLAYGGAMHNDVAPKAGREQWSFGPALAKATGERYLELDLIVPEFIKDNDSWRALPWYAHYDRDADGGSDVLMQTGPHSFVLIFRRSDNP